MDKTYRRIALGVGVLAVFVVITYFLYLSNISFDSFARLMHNTRFLGAITLVGLVVVGIPLVGFCLQRRWLPMGQIAVIREKYIFKGGISSILTLILYPYLSLILPPFFIAPLYLIGVLVPQLRDSILTYGEMFVPLPSNSFWWVALFIFWVGLGALFGLILFKIRNKGDVIQPFGNSGYILITLSEILIGVLIFCVGRMFLL